ncbi:MAG: BrnT family toxin [Planctomycetes bacterium]|nr:BrnT family toxin [Planctomycetota bacterium]
MEIEFDGAKNLANIAKHGISLAAAELMFYGSVHEFADDREEF